MFKPFTFPALLAILFLASCSQVVRNEQDDVSFWNATLVDSSFRLLYKNSDTAQALHYFDSILHQTEDVTAYPRAARYALIANYHYFFKPDNAATARMIDSALAIYNTPELKNHYPRTYVGLLLFGGQIAYRLSQYSKANEYYFRAKTLGEAYLSPCERKAFNYSIAMVLYRQENYQQSLRFFNEAYNQQATCFPQTTAIVLQQQEIQSNMGQCLVQLKNYDSALIHFDKALQIAEQYRDSLGPVTMDKIYGVIYGNKTQVAMAQNRLAEAEQLSLKSIALNDRKGYEMENALGVKLQLAEVYSRKKDFVSMAKVLNGLTSSIKGANCKWQMEWNRLMAAYHEQTAQPETALQYFKTYFALRDSISEEQRSLTAADVARQLREKEQEMQIAVLTKDNQLTVISLWVTIVFACMTLGIIVLFYQNHRRNKKNLALSLALNEEIRQQKAAREEEVSQRHKLITEAVIQAQEKERSLMGLELHDNINQVLTTVKLLNEMAIEGLGDPKVILSKSSIYLQNCINEIRSLSKRLSAPTLGKISLEESVKDLADSINLTSKVNISYELMGLENQVLPQDVHLGIYRILQEQLNNVLKHADASEVSVKLERRNDKLFLSITDNGRGFVVDSRSQGIGLMNMQTRAESLNGSFSLHSHPGKGCQVKVVIPMA